MHAMLLLCLLKGSNGNEDDYTSIDGRVRVKTESLSRVPRSAIDSHHANLLSYSRHRGRIIGLRSMQVSTSSRVLLPHQLRYANMCPSILTWPPTDYRNQVR